MPEDVRPSAPLLFVAPSCTATSKFASPPIADLGNWRGQWPELALNAMNHAVIDGAPVAIRAFRLAHNIHRGAV